MVNQANSNLARHQEMLNQREVSLQERMHRMLNQRWVSMEQEFEWRRTENLEACRADFRSKTDAALVRYKQGREALERQVRDLEADLKGAHEVRRGAEHTLAEADTTINSLRHDLQRLEEENSVMVHQIVEISRELQEARDSEAEARMLHRQRVQMFREFSARIMEAAHRLGIHGLNLPTVPEDDGSIILFFSQLAEQLDDASAKVLELIDAECRELLGLAGMRIFSNLQRLRPDLDLEEVLQRRVPPPPSTPDRTALARAAQLDIALRQLQAIYARPGMSAAAGQESSSSGNTSSSGGSGSKGAEESDDDGATESSGEASSGSSQGTGDDEDAMEAAQ
jgi:predicted  nucleic acid-binding Zn-ribbon protein